jgi:hypothetical protein
MLMSAADVSVGSEKADTFRGDRFGGSECVWVVQKVMHVILCFSKNVFQNL